MKKNWLTVVLWGCFSLATAQDYSADNRLYKTIDWDEFLQRLNANPKMIFFDIRTPGERSDTSKYVANNQGRIKGAIQTDYFDFKKYYTVYEKYKDDTIYLYCSHSMRSRRLALHLADSAFKYVVNVNGGISYLNLLGEKRYPLKKKFYETNVRYQLISALEFSRVLQDKNTQVVDIRADSVYYGTAKLEAENHVGQINGIRHIPGPILVSKELKTLDKKKPVVLFDNWGDESPIVANQLIDAGFTKVGVLHFGLTNFIDQVPSAQRTFLKTRYSIILPEELFARWERDEIHLIDIRTPSEFASTDSLAWKNVGKLKRAINIPLSEFTPGTFAKYADKPIVLYDIMMHNEIYDAAKLLRSYGIESFSLLAGGIYFVRWKVANEHRKELAHMLDK